ncbi:HAD-IIIC family phosphatase [Singulisphaera sp. PoT]|uniref:HAD-IIIC family phosphatase n=1 Tax=Singulisphaera sp. PoT TaxID=3411797 RepID=UPI003BF570DB
MSSPLNFKEIEALRKQGQGAEALALLQKQMRPAVLSAEETDKAGRLIRKVIGEGGAKPKFRVKILGQCTTSWLTTSLAAVAWGRNELIQTSEGGYDTILQDLNTPEDPQSPSDVVVLLPWSQRLLGGEGSGEDRIQAELAFWQQAWAAVGRLGARVLQVGYDWVTPGAGGFHLGGKSGGTLDRIRRMNAAIREALPEHAFFLDLEAVSGMTGRDSFYDMRRYYWTKQPFSEAGTKALAEHLWAGVRALTIGPKKVLVLDLDNTLWGGVVGELGALGVALGESADGEAHRALQRLAKDLASRGVVLAVSSKNNAADAREPFEKHRDMILALDDFGAFEANWEPKSISITRIAQTLNLGLDSFVFVDDNPAEREQVRQALPDVEVPEISEDPAEYARRLQSGLWFETVSLTDADAARSAQYVVERKRRELQESFTNLDDYLRSLEMIADVRAVDDADLSRVVQLLAKTNQFNVTTRRHSHEDVVSFMNTPGSVCLTLRLKDKFGDHGLVAVLLAVPDEKSDGSVLRIDTWLMSCRVIGRTFEQFSLRTLYKAAEGLGYRSILGEFIPTKKNALVADLFDRLGFERLPSDSEGSVLYRLSVADSTVLPEAFISEVQ